MNALHDKSQGRLNQGWTYRDRIQRDAEGSSVLAFYAGRYLHSAPQVWRERIETGQIRLDGRSVKPDDRLRAGQLLTYRRPPWREAAVPAEFGILYEDEHLIVINKHDDIIVHPARGNLSGTIINGLAYHFQHRSDGALSNVGEEFARPGVVHRLDRHTTGVMVAAKTDTAHWRLGKQFEQRTTEKRYLAVVHGRLEPYADVIDLPLGKHPTIKSKYAVRWDTRAACCME